MQIYNTMMYFSRKIEKKSMKIYKKKIYISSKVEKNSMNFYGAWNTTKKQISYFDGWGEPAFLRLAAWLVAAGCTFLEQKLIYIDPHTQYIVYNTEVRCSIGHAGLTWTKGTCDTTRMSFRW